MQTLKQLNIAIIISKTDEAGMNIYSHLEKEFSAFSHKNMIVEIKLIDKEHIHAENIDKEINADLFIFATKHKSEADKKTLCVHPIGNFGFNNFYGGKQNTLVKTSPVLIKQLFCEMKKLKQTYSALNEFEVTVEQTHHGPYLEKPALFIEIGSTEKEWTNPDAGKIISNTIFNVLSSINPLNIAMHSKTVCILGGGHYSQIANKILERTELCIGHICSKYALEHLNEDLIIQMKEKSNADFFVIDWKGCGKEKERVVGLLDKLSFEWKKSKNILYEE